MTEFKVIFDGYSYCADWKDDTRRYHIWLTADGERRDDVLHANLIDKTNLPRGKYGHHPHNSRAKKWAPIVDGIIAEIKAGGLIEKARLAHVAKRESEALARQTDIDNKRLRKLHDACKPLPGSVWCALMALPDADKLAFVVALERDT